VAQGLCGAGRGGVWLAGVAGVELAGAAGGWLAGFGLGGSAGSRWAGRLCGGCGERGARCRWCGQARDYRGGFGL